MKTKAKIAALIAALAVGGSMFVATPAFAAQVANFGAYSCPAGGVYVAGSSSLNSTYQVVRDAGRTYKNYSDGAARTYHILYSGFAVSNSASISSSGTISGAVRNCDA